jgi:hypothetical protein
MGSFLFYSCQKEDISEKAPKTKLANTKASDPYTGITVQYGMPVFQNQKHYEDVLTALETACDAHNDAFATTWASLDDDAYNDRADALGFDDEKPLKEFEARFRYNSLRNKIRIEEENWLNRPTLDEDNDPEDKYFTEDDYEQTAANAQGEYKIGKSIFVGRDNTKLYEILDGSFSTLDSLRRGLISTTKRNIKIHYLTDPINGAKRGDCFGNARTFLQQYYENATKRYKKILKIRSTCDDNDLDGRCDSDENSFVKAKIKSYKKKNNRWKKHRTTLSLRMYGHASISTDCTNLFFFNYGWIPEKRHWKHKDSEPFDGAARTQDRKIKADYKCGGHISTLDLFR